MAQLTSPAGLGTIAGATISIEELLGAPLYVIVESWRDTAASTERPAHAVHAARERAPALLAAISRLTRPPGMEEFRAALAQGDPRAERALALADEALGKAADALFERVRRWSMEREWTALRHEARLAADLAGDLGFADQQVAALIRLAKAHRALGDLPATIAAYRDAIEIGLQLNVPPVLGAAYDNLGNALLDAGELDQALASYKDALRWEERPFGRLAIASNLANAYRDAGELRTALVIYRQAIEELERSGGTPEQLAIALDNAAEALAGVGEPREAIEWLERAETLFSRENLEGRVTNALLRVHHHNRAGNTEAAGRAFEEAHELAVEHAHRSVDPAHYREGFRRARATALARDSEPMRLFAEGLAAKTADAWEAALERWMRARDLAQDAGDAAFVLRIEANMVAVLSDAGAVEDAMKFAVEVRRAAGRRGLARPEAMVLGTLASLASGGADVHLPLGPLGALVTCARLNEVHADVVKRANLDPDEAQWETQDVGTVDLALGRRAAEAHANALAVRYLRTAVDKARANDAPFELANRLATLYDALHEQGDTMAAATIAEELAAILASGTLPPRGVIVARRTIARELLEKDPKAAIEHLRRALGAVEELRAQRPPGTRRTDVGRHYQGTGRMLARLLRTAGDEAGSFEAVQLDQGRRLIDALAATAAGAGGPANDAAPTADEVHDLLREIGDTPKTALVDLAVERDGLTAYVLADGRVRAIHAPGDISELFNVDVGDAREREARAIELCRTHPVLTALMPQVDEALPAAARPLVVSDTALANLPLHVTPVGGRALCDRRSIGYLAAAGTLRFAPRRRSPAGRSLVAGDSRGDLPHARDECIAVANVVGAEPLLGPRCTVSAIQDVLRAGELDLVHLAVHGRGDVRRGGRASLMLADGEGGTEWVLFDQLAELALRAELVVLSGCSTAVTGPHHGFELIGVARAAAEAGAAAVVACLWPVGDEAARVCMTEFHRVLAERRGSGPVDLREALDGGRNALRRWLDEAGDVGVRRRDGRDARPPLAAVPQPQIDPSLAGVVEWAPFVLLGDPILGD